MFKPFPLFIGLRYAGQKRKNQLVSFISLMSVVGMALGVALLILVLSVMNGFDRELQTRILGLVPHIAVNPYGDQSDDQTQRAEAFAKIVKLAEQHPAVKAVAPFTQLTAMLVRGTEVDGVALFGINPALERNVSIIGDYIDSAALDSLQANSNAIILGASLAARLGLTVGDKVNIIVTNENSVGRARPKTARFKLAAVFRTGTKLDQNAGLIALQTSLNLLPKNRRQQGLRLTLHDAFQAPGVSWQLSPELPAGFINSDWTRSYGNIYSAIQLSKQLVGLMLLTIIAVAAFNVVSALVMIVTDKGGDIAILRTIGASRGAIMAIFIVQGTLIALIGTGAGAVIGTLLSLGITDMVAFVENLLGFQFLNSDVYPVDYLPSDLRLSDILRVCATAFAMSILATLYPAWRASRVQPAEALRNE